MCCIICVMGALTSKALRPVMQRNKWRGQDTVRVTSATFSLERKPRNGLRSIVGWLSKARSAIKSRFKYPRRYRKEKGHQTSGGLVSAFGVDTASFAGKARHNNPTTRSQSASLID